MKTIIYLALSFFCLGAIQAQKSNITGTITDDQNEGLISASVIILNQQDSSLVGFSLTNDDGYFKILDVPQGSYLFQATYLGYEQYSDTIDVSGQTRNQDIGTLALAPTSAQLEQVTIEGERMPMMVRQDTLVYNADAFAVQPNDVVEDLLRRLPGVEVENDGTIIAQGEEVEKVLVDGKKFFGDDVQVATKNLPADAVDKVEIYDKKSDMSEFSGVDDGEREKTINLELKEDKKKGGFGTFTGGYGTEDRYLGRLSYNRFSSKMQLSFLGNVNNINEQGFSVAEYMNFMGGMGGFGGRGGLNIGGGLSNGFVDTKSGGINFNYDISEKTDLQLSYFVNIIDNTIDQFASAENFVPGAYFLSTETSNQLSSNNNHRINVQLEHEIDSTQDLRLDGSFTINDGDLTLGQMSQFIDESDITENNLNLGYNSFGDNDNISGSLLYRKRFGAKESGTTFTLRGSLNDVQNITEGFLDSENEFFPDDPALMYTELILQNQLQNDDQQNYTLEASYVTPIAGTNYFELKYSRQNFNDDIVREVYDDVQGTLNFNDSLSSHYLRNFYYDRFTVGLILNSEKSQLTLEGAVQNSQLNGDIISNDILIENNILRVLPRLNWRYDLGNSSNIRVRYSTSVREPSLTQLNPIVDNSNPQSIYIGNPDLVPEYRHALRMNYYNYDQFTFRSIFAFINATYTKNSITNQTIRGIGTQTRTPVNVDYSFNLNGTLSFSTPIRPLGIKVDLRKRLGYTTGPIFLNDIEAHRNNYNGNIRATIENRKKEIIDWRVGGSYGYNVNNFGDDSRNNQSFSNQNLFADFTYNIKNSMSIQTGISVDFFSEEQFGESQTVPLWSASISKYILKDQRGELKLSVFDILNQNLGIERTNTLNYVENREIQTLSQYFMLSFTYAIKRAGGGGGSGKGMRRR